MHEYGLIQDVVDRALVECQRARASAVSRVRIEVGEFAVASNESLETAYEILTRGTPLEHSTLEIAQVAGHAVCPACGFEGAAADLGDELSEPPALLLCPHCGLPLLVTEGAGITLVQIVLADGARASQDAAISLRYGDGA